MMKRYQPMGRGTFPTESDEVGRFSPSYRSVMRLHETVDHLVELYPGACVAGMPVVTARLEARVRSSLVTPDATGHFRGEGSGDD